MLELNIKGVPNEIEKIVLESKYIYIVKFNFPSGVKTIWVDFSNQRGISYDNPNISEAVPIARFSEIPTHLYTRFGSEPSQRPIISVPEPTTYPACIYGGDPEETDLEPDVYIRMIPETLDEFKERNQPRITEIGYRLVHGLPHLLPHLVSKERSVCNDIGSDAITRQFDHAANSLRLFIGYIQRMMDTLTTLDRAVMADMEALVDELEDVTPDNQNDIIHLFTKQNFADWETVSSERKVCAGMNADGTPGRLVYDINAQHIGDNPLSDDNIKHNLAEDEFYELSVTCYRSTIFTDQSELVTQRDLLLETYIPAEKEARLRDLVPRIPAGNLFTLPTPIATPTSFDPEVLEYTIDLSQFYLNTIRSIEILAEAFAGTPVITGLGNLTDLYTIDDTTTELIAPIIVTSEDGTATRTYTITFTNINSTS